MFAIIKTGGKQYRAEAGAKLRVEKLEANPGETVEFDALMLGGEKTVWGTPTVPGAKVVAEVLGQGKGKKVIVAKFKAKIHYRRKKGHRQPYTEILVKEIRA
ncbi:50S ribosomal protein L21 [Meiothermus granaticius]|uniref:Large ribosomal subunit protein bL21 n=1 Tax=Meiothermus granaticius NBRC 107808 TaxID=1227551 RepID=A0A399FDQ5_9DEIN|nr:50S ribosomal protein L21 [Meiothermus granaticius]MCL6525381.1 50S ribosomal protein L21 [Thermaceae bacterium]RIH92981.1 50S ribosomal protein L21 [Meiothermus granaticius NBRC 107808]GEM86181.1 50S ribosomal protein L21 [Meiothermus granaticius NBRC 107808]